MNDKSRHRPKESTRERTGTTYQLNSRQSRNYLSGRIVSMVRDNDSVGEFSAQELINIESILRDEMQTNPWLLNVCKAITDEGIVVSKEAIDLYNNCRSEGQDVCVTQSEVEELHKELDFLKERVHVLRYILKDLTEKLAEIRRNDSNIKFNGNENHLTEIWPKLRIKLMEFLDIMKKDINSELCVEDPKDVSEQLVNILNDKLVAIDGIESPNQWLSKQLDVLALSEDNRRQVFENFNNHFCLKLEDIHKNLIVLNKECLRIKEFYEKDVTEEMSWRTDLNTILGHLQNDYNLDPIRLNSAQTQTNCLSAKKQLIEEYSKTFKSVQNLEFDEFRALIHKLKERIDCLSKKE